MKKLYQLTGIAVLIGITACKDNTSDIPDDGNQQSGTLPEWYYTGGELGTAFLATSNALEQPTPAVEQSGMDSQFKNGEALFEKPFMSNHEGVRSGLGPVYIRTSCIHCHPGYGHGKRLSAGTFETNSIGNGCLLVVYNPQTDAYVSWLAGMPQTHAVEPFKAPLDESKITVEWKSHTDEWNNTFPDGETYELQYPEITIPKEAIYVYNQGYTLPEDYAVRLESTIGIYGTGLLDAISDDDLKAEYTRQETDGILPNGINPAFFKNGEWVKQYCNTKPTDIAPGTVAEEHPYRFTYALSRGPLQDAAGINALWNITNVTRSNRRYHYLDAAGTYAEYSSKDPDVQAGYKDYIEQVDPEKNHPTWHPASDNADDMAEAIKAYLTSTELDVEMSDEDYVDFMVWHRGLAVPAARNVDDPNVLKGKELFEQIGCTYCHKPSWTTGDDNFYDPNGFFSKGDSRLPKYPNQKIWPYSDMIQHKLFMVNDIRTGWCRTSP